MAVRRFFLNLGMLLVLIGLVAAGVTFIGNFKYQLVTATVVDHQDSTSQYQNSDGTFTDRTVTYPVVSYSYEGFTYRDTIYYAKDVSYKDLHSLKEGQKVQVYVLKRDPDHCEKPGFYYTALIFGIPGLILMLIFAKAFKGYYNDFIRRYPKAMGITMAAQLLALFVDPILLEYSDNSTGLGGMGWFVFMLIVDCALATIVLAVWLGVLIMSTGNKMKG